LKVQEIKTNKLLAKLKRSPADHKGKFGHVMIVGGNIGFGGAGLLASKAAVCS
jgi:NAD(P)H-hydrate epimerase